jgi:hypothetical protein
MSDFEITTKQNFRVSYPFQKTHGQDLTLTPLLSSSPLLKVVQVLIYLKSYRQATFKREGEGGGRCWGKQGTYCLGSIPVSVPPI